MLRQPEKNKAELPKKQEETDWDGVIMAGFLAFLSSLQKSSLDIIVFPYMNQIDPLSDVTFFGLMSSLSLAVCALSSLLFAFWSYNIQKFKPALLTGRIVAFIGCLLFIFVELLPIGRRFAIMFIYLLLGISDGSTSVLSIYAPTLVSKKHSALARYAVGFGYIMGHLSGPVIAIAFSPLEYAVERVHLNQIHTHAYSAVIWTAVAINVGSMFYAILTFDDFDKEKTAKELVNKCSFEWIKKELEYVGSHKVRWLPVVCCWFLKAFTELNAATFTTLAAPLFIYYFGLSGEVTVLFFALCACASRAMSLGINKWSETNCWKQTYAPPCVTIILICNLIVFLFSLLVALLCYPLPTTTHDCSLNAIPIGIVISAYLILMGLLLPIVRLSIETTYAAALRIDPSLHCELFAITNEMVSIWGPFIVSLLYSLAGLPILWLINVIVIVISLLLMIPTFCPYRSLESVLQSNASSLE